MKKIISLLMTLTLIFSSAVFVSADTKYSDAVFELSGLGIISSTETEGSMTRGEFAEIIVSLIGMDEICESVYPTTRYEDVSITASYAKSISLLSQLGILNGVDDSHFKPEDPVGLEQAVKVLVVCAGYESVAEKEGGWPSGYMNVAAKFRLVNKVSGSKPPTHGDIYQMIYNALDVELLVPEIGKSGNYAKSGDTFRELIMNGKGGKIHLQTGIVTANVFSYTESAVADLCENEVVIDSVIYEIGNTDAYNLLGHKVDFYALEKENGGYILLGIRPSVSDNAIKIAAENIEGKSGTVFSYRNKGNKVEKVTINSYTKVLYNGTRVLYPKDEMYDFENGFITLFDHNNDKIIDVAMIEEYVSVVAESFRNNQLIFRNNFYFDGKNSLSVDPEAKGMYLEVVDADGKKVDNFDGERVVSIFKDLTATRYKVIVSDKIIEGTIKERSEDEVVLNNDEIYGIEAGRNIDLSFGKTFTVYVNFNGEIVFTYNQEISSYAYILDVDHSGHRNGLCANMILSGKVDFGVDINEEDVNDTSQIPFLVSRNSSVEYVDFADKVKVDGEKYSGSELRSILTGFVNIPISYQLDEDGKIKEITTQIHYGGCTESDILYSTGKRNRSKYNVYEMVFGGSENLVGFAISPDTQVICVPNGERNDENCMVTVKIDVGNNETGYLASGYSYDVITKTADLLVIHADMDAEQVRGVNLTSSRAVVVSSIRNVYSEDEDEYQKVFSIISEDGEKVLYPMEVNQDNQIINSVKNGDIINYITNNEGLVENVMIFRSVKNLSDDFEIYSPDNYTELFGQSVQLVTNEIDSLNYVKVSNLTLDINGTTKVVSIPQRNKPPVYLYDKDTDSIEPAQLNNIIAGQDKVYILARTGDNAIRAVVIVR